MTLGRLIRIGVSLAYCVCCCSAARAQLPPTLAAAAKQAGIPESSIALWIAPAAAGGALTEHNAGAALNPASLMKLVTTIAALDLMGPHYQWRTEAFTDGVRDSTVLKGDLILRGSGDPFLTWDKLGQWLREWRSRGIQHIHGDLVLDRSLFASEPAPLNGFDEEPLRAYNATPDALLVNFKALSLRINAVANSDKVEVASLTPLTPLTIDNRLVGTSGPCTNWRAGWQSQLRQDEQGFLITLVGNIPASCGERILHLTVQDGAFFFSAIFRALWQEMGGTWQGKLREGSVTPSAQPLSQWYSPPLADVVRDINKYSNNVMARQLFLSLGAHLLTPPTSRQQAEAAVKLWLNANDISLPQLVIDNGSGLSRHERITAEGLGRLLQYAWRGPRMPELISSLPIAGLDGTGRRRFAEQAVAGRAYLKSGSLRDVAALAGYVLDAANQWKIAVILINHPNVGAADAVLQSAVEAAYR